MQNSEPMEMCSICLRDEKTAGRLHAECLPIPHFGNYTNAKVATIGLNPAYSATFRLQTVHEFRKQKRSELTDEDILNAAAWRNSYFNDTRREWHPYFKALDSVLGRAHWHWSYASGRAVHLDLAACATKEAFGNETPECQALLMSNCRLHFLESLGRLPQGVLLLINGERVFAKLREFSSDIKSREELINIFGHRGNLGSISFGSREYEFRAWNKPITARTHPVFLTDLATWLHGAK